MIGNSDWFNLLMIIIIDRWFLSGTFILVITSFIKIYFSRLYCWCFWYFSKFIPSLVHVHLLWWAHWFTMIMVPLVAFHQNRLGICSSLIDIKFIMNLIAYRWSSFTDFRRLSGNSWCLIASHRIYWFLNYFIIFVFWSWESMIFEYVSELLSHFLKLLFNLFFMLYFWWSSSYASSTTIDYSF